MQQIISVQEDVNDVLCELRDKYADDKGKPASYNLVIRKALKKAGLWKERLNHKE